MFSKTDWEFRKVLAPSLSRDFYIILEFRNFGKSDLLIEAKLTVQKSAYFHLRQTLIWHDQIKSCNSDILK